MFPRMSFIPSRDNLAITVKLTLRQSNHPLPNSRAYSINGHIIIAKGSIIHLIVTRITVEMNCKILPLSTYLVNLKALKPKSP